MKKIVIAIDGPSASGKSTTAKLVAKNIGYLHLDTGAMYRAITFWILLNKINPNEIDKIKNFVKDIKLRFTHSDNSFKIFVNDLDVTEEIRSPEVTKNVSYISSLSFVRELMVKEQKEIGINGEVVCEGRDIGTVVFPSAELKIFLVASAKARAKRRAIDFEKSGFKKNIDEIEMEIIKRDELDSNRDLSPLRKAEDAIELDTTNLTIDEQVNFIVKIANEKINGSSN